MDNSSGEDEFFDCSEENVATPSEGGSTPGLENLSLESRAMEQTNETPTLDKEDRKDSKHGETCKDMERGDVGSQETSVLSQDSSPAASKDQGFKISDSEAGPILENSSQTESCAPETTDLAGAQKAGHGEESADYCAPPEFESYDMKAGVRNTEEKIQSEQEAKVIGDAQGQNCEEELENDDESSEDESSLTEDEIKERGAESKKLKDEGNAEYKKGDFSEAERLYTQGLKVCPKCLKKERAILYSNRSACLVKLDKTEPAIEDCTKAVELLPTYLKAFLRRAQLFEKTEKYEEAMKDYEEVLKLDPSNQSANSALVELPKKIEERNEKLKAQMMTSLKDLGNLFLRPFGLSTDNFQLQQDANSGSYNIQFNNGPQQQNRPNNGPTNGPSNGR